MRGAVSALGFLGLLVGTATAARGAVRYAVSDIGTFGGERSYSVDVNATRAVLASVYMDTADPFSGRSFVWSEGAVTEILVPGGNNVLGTGINASGQIAGQYQTSWGVRGFLWTAGVGTQLVPLSGDLAGSVSKANGLNDAGAAAGLSYTAQGFTHATLWSGSTRTDLGTLGGTFSIAAGLNNAGQVVGESRTTNGAMHAFLWTGGKMTDVHPAGGASSLARAINDAGVVVGEYYTGQATRAFRWSAGVVTDLGAIGSGTETSAYGINSVGDVIGMSNGKAFLYTGGAMLAIDNLLDAGSAGWTITAVSGITDSGVIVADGHDIYGVTHTLILTPAPEPSTVMPVGLALVAARRRRRR